MVTGVIISPLKNYRQTPTPVLPFPCTSLQIPPTYADKRSMGVRFFIAADVSALIIGGLAALVIAVVTSMKENE